MNELTLTEIAFRAVLSMVVLLGIPFFVVLGGYVIARLIAVITGEKWDCD